jgi:hypothetical protein
VQALHRESGVQALHRELGVQALRQEILTVTYAAWIKLFHHS